MRQLKRPFTVIAMLLAALILGACQPTPAQPIVVPTATPSPKPTATPSPDAVLNASLAAFRAGDLDASLAFYADDAVYTLLMPGQPQTYTGKEEMLAWWEDLLANNFEMEVEILQVEGDRLTARTKIWDDSLRGLGVAPLVATEVYTIQDGKIKAVTWTPTEETLAKLGAAMAAAQPITVEDLIGTWYQASGWGGKTSATYYIEFGADGTFRAAPTLSQLETMPDGVGPYQLEGALLTLMPGEGHKCAGQTGSYEVELTEKGWLRFTVREDPCQSRAEGFQWAPWLPGTP